MWSTAVRMKRIVIYGGTDLDDRAINMVQHVVRALLRYQDTIIVTGGIIGVKDEHGATLERVTPTDLAARRAAEEVLKGQNIRDRLETWLPEPDEDDRRNLKRDWARAPRTFHGTIAGGRGFALVLNTDAFIPLKEKPHTATVLELALRARKPALP